MRAEQGIVWWFSYRNHDGRRWRVGFSTSDVIPELTGPNGEGYAVTMFEPRCVLLHVHYPPRTYPATLAHEGGHVALDGKDLPRAQEERFVEAASRGLVCLATRLGVRLPPIPAAAKRMRRRWLAAQRRKAC